MAIYRIYPEKDTYINSYSTSGGFYANAGKDEILEIGGYVDIDQSGQAKRTLIQFKQSEIEKVVNTKISGPISASLNLSLANATELPASYSIFALPVTQSWTEGLGKGDDTPNNTTGCSWKYRDNGATEWATLGGDFTSSLSSTASYDVNDDHDLSLDVTSIVAAHYSGSLTNNGMILKIDDDIEFNTTSSTLLKYFSNNTNTVYRPYLEFKWDDAVVTGSLTELDTDIATVKIKNARENYSINDSIKFRLSARPKYPTRTFTTSSIYLTEYKLPTASYWGIKDEMTDEMIIDFDTSFTKISADNTSAYFNVDMNALSPERYYRLLVKSTINDNTIIIDDKNIFKVTKHG